MSIVTLARTEVRIARRSRSFFAIVSALVVASLVIVSMMSSDGFANTYFQNYRTMTGVAILALNLASPSWIVFSFVFLVPLLGLLFGSSTIVDDRRAGRIRTALSTPCARREVLLGKLLGRFLVFAFAVVVALAVAAVAAYVRFGIVPNAAYLRFVAMTIIYGWLFVTLGVCLSTLFETKRRTVVATVAMYVLCTPFGWNVLVSSLPLPSLGLRAIEPTTAYAILVAGSFDDLEATLRVTTALGSDGGRSSEVFRIWSTVSEQVPIYLSSWGAALILVGWMLLATALASLAFSRTELNP
ncbi:ABC-type transport system permease protein [Natrialba magadii ATCC 43099]|uniref:ABC-type transport system permease protein n=1 Tax=Natrialba magadii (strain ATCC 43099 / DSM 3394 / CCM 3739 / CIP 104546 / IAM 13178 / JCM 8861 / NBRC 102185 / NCIMB 2190 / MS3) TaxID=547559 RepID=D3SWR0_NATMM|nr:ABC transporter permease subunit [Natrialba magadii]ADD05792.1 ABC-type transport system permease protein [Natrialba magadii ATCC 43099]ELY30132.1 hypothetical protein C500_09269 [Natrialba magadii ATCC 43099]